MSNTLITPVGLGLIARAGVLVLENNMVLGNMVSRQLDGEFRQVGDTINVRKYSTFESQEFSTTTSAQNISETSVPVKLDKLLDISVELTAKQQTLDIVDFTAQVLEPIMRAHAQKVDTLIAGLYKAIPYYSGSAASTPSTKAAITGIRKVLNDNKVPTNDRWLVIDTAAEDKLLQLEGFSDASAVGDAGSALREGSLTRKYGFNIEMDQNIPWHVAGVPGGSPVATGAIGDSSVGITAGGAAGTYKEGDLISIAGDTTKYVVTEDLTLNGSGVGTLKIYPKLVATASSDAVTLVASHRANLAFQRGALCLATAPLELPMGGVISAQTNFRNLPLRVTYGYNMEYKKNMLSVDMLCGVKALLPEAAGRLLG